MQKDYFAIFCMLQFFNYPIFLRILLRYSRLPIFINGVKYIFRHLNYRYVITKITFILKHYAVDYSIF